MEITEMLGGNPLKLTQRRKAEAEMELRALKIEQLEAERKRERKGKVLVNPNRIKIPSAIGPNPHQWTASSNQTTIPSTKPGLIHLPPQHVIPPVTHQPVVQEQVLPPSIVPPVFVHKPNTIAPNIKNSMPSTTLPKEKKNELASDLVLPQDRNKKYESHSDSDSDNRLATDLNHVLRIVIIVKEAVIVVMIAADGDAILQISSTYHYNTSKVSRIEIFAKQICLSFLLI